MANSAAPFRAEHVGSLLRPAELQQARDHRANGKISQAELGKIEDRCITRAVHLQEDVGLQAITDGEFRRTYFHVDFLEKLRGVVVEGGIPIKFRSADGEVDFAPPRLEIRGKLQHQEPIQAGDFTFTSSLTTRCVKVCIPSPTMAHFRGGRAAIDQRAYPDIEEFFTDLAQCYRDELASLAEAGCRYVQLDDTNLAYLCDENMRQGARERGEDPDQLPYTYARLINQSIAQRHDDMTIAIHLCRGNFKSAWVADGGYDPVAETLFNEIDVDGFFLEYDDDRSGGFEPLRFVPADKRVVLGLWTTKTGTLESDDNIKKRIEQAAAYIDPQQLCLSPQCGFSSTAHGNVISEEQQEAKLRAVVRIADAMWG